MDIDLLSKIVKELILDKDEVTLPGVGTFVAEIVPSTFSDKGYTINPPYKRLSFRQKEADDGNLLISFYAKSNGIDTETAARIMHEFLSEMRHILEVKKTIIFPGLGKLRATRENCFFFIADEDLDIYPEGFGLEPISLKTHEESPAEVSATMATLRSILKGDEDEDDAQVPMTAKVNAEVPSAVSPSNTTGKDSKQDTGIDTDAEAKVETEAMEKAGPNAEAATEAEVKSEENTKEEVLPVAEDVASDTEAKDMTEAASETAEIIPEATKETQDAAEADETSPVGKAEESTGDAEESADGNKQTTSEPAAIAIQDMTKDESETASKQELMEPLKADTAEAASNASEKQNQEAGETAKYNTKATAGKDSNEENKDQTTDSGTSEGKTAVTPVIEASEQARRHTGWKILKWTIIALVILALTALVAFLVLAHIAPDFIDSILYTPEELEILNM